MTDRNVRRSAIIGLVITAVLVAATMSIGGLHIFERRYTLQADFASASGINGGDPVRVAGVEVGQVTGVERLPERRAVRVSMKVSKKTWLATGTRASIRLRTLLGSRYISLDTPSTGRKLAAGALIPASRTEVPVELDQTLDALNHVAQPFDVNALNQLVNAFAKGLDGHAPQLNTMLHDLATLSGAMASRTGDIDRLIAATQKLSTAVDDRRQALGAGIDNFAAILDTLSARRQQLVELVTGVKGLSERLTPLLAKNQGTLDTTLTDLITTVGVLDKQRQRLDLALGNFPEFARRLISITSDGSFINIYYVGTIPGPYLADPVDLGDAHSGDPGKDGGLPRIWVQPPATYPSADAGGVQVKGGNDTPPPPEGDGK